MRIISLEYANYLKWIFLLSPIYHWIHFIANFGIKGYCANLYSAAVLWILYIKLDFVMNPDFLIIKSVSLLATQFQWTCIIANQVKVNIENHTTASLFQVLIFMTFHVVCSIVAAKAAVCKQLKIMQLLLLLACWWRRSLVCTLFTYPSFFATCLYPLIFLLHLYCQVIC